MGRFCNSQSLCEISLRTDLQEALSPERHTGVQIWGGEAHPSSTKEGRKSPQMHFRLNYAHVHRAFALIHEVSGEERKVLFLPPFYR